MAKRWLTRSPSDCLKSGRAVRTGRRRTCRCSWRWNRYSRPRSSAMMSSPAAWRGPTTASRLVGESAAGIGSVAPDPRSTSELVPGTQQEVTSLLEVVVHAVAHRIHVLKLELVGQVQ